MKTPRRPEETHTTSAGGGGPLAAVFDNPMPHNRNGGSSGGGLADVFGTPANSGRMKGQAAGWRPDPSDARRERFFDGAAFTSWTRPKQGMPQLLPKAPVDRSQIVTTRPERPGPADSKTRWVTAVLLLVGLVLAGWASWNLFGSNLYGQWRQAQLADQLAEGGADNPTMAVATDENGVVVLPVAAGVFDSMPTTANQPAAEPEAEAAPQPEEPAPEEPASAEPSLADKALAADEGTPLGRISIPAIGVDQLVVAGTSRPALNNGPGWMKGTALPGLPGNSVISGHRTTYGAPFNQIDDLDLGDRITVELEGQPAATYEVREKFLVTPDQTGVVYPTDGVRLTLTTCANADGSPGGDSHRWVVQAELVDGPNVDKAVPADSWTAQR